MNAPLGRCECRGKHEGHAFTLLSSERCVSDAVRVLTIRDDSPSGFIEGFQDPGPPVESKMAMCEPCAAHAEKPAKGQTLEERLETWLCGSKGIACPCARCIAIRDAIAALREKDQEIARLKALNDARCPVCGEPLECSNCGLVVKP